MFSKEDIDTLPNDLAEAGDQICKQFINKSKGTRRDREELLTAYDFLNSFLNATGMEPGEPIDGTLEDDTIRRIVWEFFSEKAAEFATTRNRRVFGRAFEGKYGASFAYEFSDGDVRIIQQKINELRDLIADNEYMDDGFRSRLLKRLEKLQAEFHKRMSDLDRFWGLLGDAGVAVGKFGEDAKPFFDRARELMQIVWRTQARAEELPTNSPLPELGQEDG